MSKSANAGIKLVTRLFKICDFNPHLRVTSNKYGIGVISFVSRSILKYLIEIIMPRSCLLVLGNSLRRTWHR